MLLTILGGKIMITLILKRVALIVSSVVLTSSVVLAHESKQESDAEHKHVDGAIKEADTSMGHHAFVHPFVAHMGMPDEPGELSVRLMSITERNAGLANGTYGFHLETGVMNRLGLHLRNDGVATHKSTEMMLQYAVLKSGQNGIAIIGEVEFPTGSTADNQNKFMYGISFAYYWESILSVNSVVHYNPQQKMTEWEIASVSPLTEKIFPVLEFRGEAGKDMSIANALLALKFKILNGNAIGLGYQVPISTNRDYDSQLIAQAEFNFN